MKEISHPTDYFCVIIIIIIIILVVVKIDNSQTSDRVITLGFGFVFAAVLCLHLLKSVFFCMFVSRSAKEAEDKIKKALDKGEVLPTEARFDSNCITPGRTTFWLQ